LTVTREQAAWLVAWKDGKFIDQIVYHASIDDTAIPLQQKPDLLAKAALHYCMGGAFHPGCELP
jgi:L-lysine epsilon oxidase C-terminal domain